jgi:glutathione S-transferase
VVSLERQKKMLLLSNNGYHVRHHVSTLLGGCIDHAVILGANSHLLKAIGGWFRPLTGSAPYNKAAVEACKADVHAHAALLEAALLKSTFLVGHRITLADIIVAAFLSRGFEYVS